jgi:hypothetical protein
MVERFDLRYCDGRVMEEEDRAKEISITLEAPLPSFAVHFERGILVLCFYFVLGVNPLGIGQIA